MVYKFFPNIKKDNRGLPLQAGITIVEVAVVVFLIAVFSLILISDFPKILKQSALSSAVYKVSQDLRRTEDLGLSGVQIKDGGSPPQQITTIRGYGFYVDVSNPPAKKYIIYADVADQSGVSDKKYSGNSTYPLCKNVDLNTLQNRTLYTDCVVEVIDVSKQNSSLYIDRVENINGTHTSVNFSPPSPTIDIDNLMQGSGITIILSNGLSERRIFVNTSGLINVE